MPKMSVMNRQRSECGTRCGRSSMSRMKTASLTASCITAILRGGRGKEGGRGREEGSERERECERESVKESVRERVCVSVRGSERES